MKTTLLDDERDITSGFDEPRRRSSSLDSLDNLHEGDAAYNEIPRVVNSSQDRYTDLSSIDWIQESARERQRKLLLSNDQTLNGKTTRFLDQTQTWIIISVTGILVGVIAATIDIVSLYLGDLKEGYCRPSFYLSKSFCCWGLTEEQVCHDWTVWSTSANVDSQGGGYALNYFIYCIYAAAFAATASFLVANFAPYASHSGIPELKVMLSGIVIKRFLGKMTLLVKSLGLCLAVSSGLWLGKEGPLVHVAACCGSIVLKFFPAVRGNEARKREIFSAAAAAGMSVSFGSPVGGVLFALEQISYYFPDRSMWQSFVCAMISSVALQMMNPFRTGKLVLYQVIFDRDWHRFELIPFTFLGLLGGIYGAYFIKLNRSLQRMRSDTWISAYPTTEVACIALVTALISFPNVFTRIPASRVLTDLLQECSQGNWLDLCTEGHLLGSILLLFSAAVLGSVLSAATFGAKIPAGIILPSMTVGAALGRAIGMIVQHWHRSYPNAWIFSTCVSDLECVTPGVYAIVGAAAALSGVTRMTVSLVVIMFELTGALTYVLPIMIAVMTAKFVGDAFGKQGIYESWIELQNYPFLNKDDDSFYGITVQQVMRPVVDLSVIYVSDRNTVQSMRRLLDTDELDGYPVLTDPESKTLLGYIRSIDIERSLSGSSAAQESTLVVFTKASQRENTTAIDMRSFLDDTPFVLGVQSNMRLVVNLFQQMGLRYVFLGRRGRLDGMIDKNDLLNAKSSQSQWISNARTIDQDALSGVHQGPLRKMDVRL